jgi:ATP-dependent RNA helicase DBP3
LDQWGTTVKKATHSAYGAFYKEGVTGTAKKITFD